jgi:hypothetical protein
MSCGDLNERGMTVMDIALVLFTALFLATVVIPALAVEGIHFWAMVAHLRV